MSMYMHPSLSMQLVHDRREKVSRDVNHSRLYHEQKRVRVSVHSP
jgi:hypothetical protein